MLYYILEGVYDGVLSHQ